MPKTARRQEDIELVKQLILDAAIEIFVSEGFARLSMRKIASRVSMTAANLYNYFSNKDDIFLAIQTRGFEELTRRFQEIDGETFDDLEKLKRMTRAYYEFGTENTELYEIMFTTRNAPGYTDYIGTSLEPAARRERETALQVLGIISGLIHRLMTNSTLDESHQKAISHWTALHGIVSLHNSRVLQAATEVTEKRIEEMLTDLIPPIVTGH